MKIDLPEIFKDKTVYVVASGESLMGFDFDRLRGKNIIAINDVLKYIPFAQVLVACDTGWNDRNKHLAQNYKGYKIMFAGKGRPGWNYFIDQGMTEDKLILRNTRNTGFHAMVAALKLGASKIYLLGFDITWKKQPYFYEIPYDKVREYKSSMHRKDAHLRYFEYYKDYNIINASPDSAITYFPKCSLDEIL
ncbi:MAG: hypothetical protein HQ541_18660 [Mariniphaga sp.]|nr:hypothetical protein [Mariniphaga sp.]